MSSELNPGLRTRREIAEMASKHHGRQIPPDAVRKREQTLGIEPAGRTRRTGQSELPGYTDEQSEQLIAALETYESKSEPKGLSTKRPPSKPTMATIYLLRVLRHSGQVLYKIGNTKHRDVENRQKEARTYGGKQVKLLHHFRALSDVEEMSRNHVIKVVGGVQQGNETFWPDETKDVVDVLRSYQRIASSVETPSTKADGSGEWVEGE